MRSTRRGFGRRALSFGLAIFCAITLMSVGFAAWVLSNNASLDSTGGIKTETITNKAITIEITNAYNKVLYDEFDDTGKGIAGKEQNLAFSHLPATHKDAQTGFIVTDDEEGKAQNEDLLFTVKGTVDNIDKIGELYFNVRVPNSLITAAGLTRTDNGDGTITWSYDPAKAFVRLPSFARTEDGKVIPYITGTLTAPDGEGNVKYEFPAKTDNWTGAMTQDVLWEEPSTLLTDGTQEISDLDGNKYTINYVTDRTDKLQFELTIKFEWGARYLGMNPNYFYDVDEREKGTHDTLTTFDEDPNPYTTGSMSSANYDRSNAYDNINLVQYDYLLLQAVINGLDLGDLLDGETVVPQEGSFVDTDITLDATSATLEDYIKNNSDGISTKLAYLQHNISVAISKFGTSGYGSAPIYTFAIGANVK